MSITQTFHSIKLLAYPFRKIIDFRVFLTINYEKFPLGQHLTV